MKKILLICNAGMSTSVIVKKMLEHAKSRGIEVQIDAIGDGADEKKLSEADVVLLGPQVRYLRSKLEQSVSVPVDVIDMQDYGMMRGDRILDQALKIIKE